MKNQSVDGDNRLTPEQFKAIAKYKGWSYVKLGERWGYTAVWISNMARDPERPVRFDDMLMGLPNLKRLRRDLAARRSKIDAAMALRPVPHHPKTLPPGLRYRGYLAVGSIVTASTDVGSIAEIGERGLVFQVLSNSREKLETYGVLFENGLWDWFTPDYVDTYLAGTGLTAPGADEYAYTSEEQLQADYAAGLFMFWPS